MCACVCDERYDCEYAYQRLIWINQRAAAAKETHYKHNNNEIIQEEKGK